MGTLACSRLCACIPEGCSCSPGDWTISGLGIQELPPIPTSTSSELFFHACPFLGTFCLVQGIRVLFHLYSYSIIIFLNFPCLNYCVVSASWLDPDWNTFHVTQLSKRKDESKRNLLGISLRACWEPARLYWFVHRSWSLEGKHQTIAMYRLLTRASKAHEAPQEVTACIAAFLF